MQIIVLILHVILILDNVRAIVCRYNRVNWTFLFDPLFHVRLRDIFS